MIRARLLGAIAVAVVLTSIAFLTPQARATDAVPSGKSLGFNSQLGAWYHTIPSSGISPAQEADLIRHAGGNTQRITVSWAEVQPTRPPAAGPQLPAVMAIDASVRALVQRQMRPVITIINAPLWASTVSSCRVLDLNCWLARQINEHLAPAGWAVTAYARFVQALAARYPTAQIETWNEPNEAYWWQDGLSMYTPNAVVMAQMQCAAYDAVKQLGNPGQLVLSPGFGNALATTTQTVTRKLLFRVVITTAAFGDYVAAMYNAMGRTCWDRLNVHLYYDGDLATPGSRFDRSWQMMRQTRSVATPAETSPIWVTETGISTTGAQPATPEVQFAVQTEGVRRMLAMPDVEAVLVHSLRDAPMASELLRPGGPEYGFGMLYANGRPKPAYCVYVKLAGNGYPGC